MGLSPLRQRLINTEYIPYMRRFFIDPDKITATNATITGDEAHHISDVLRLKPGITIELFDGTGKVYQARIEHIAKKQVETVILADREETADNGCLSLGVAMLTGKKMDLVVQKATELGVAAIHPYVSQHSSVKERNPNKEQRWQRIALEACKQCNRPTVPECKQVSDFSALLEEGKDAAVKIIFWEQEQSSTLGELFPAESHPPTTVMALFGPEGGFSREEINQAIDQGFTPVSLGNRILRAETAVISGSAILQFLLGNLTPGKQ